WDSRSAQTAPTPAAAAAHRPHRRDLLRDLARRQCDSGGRASSGRGTSRRCRRSACTAAAVRWRPARRNATLHWLRGLLRVQRTLAPTTVAKSDVELATRNWPGSAITCRSSQSAKNSSSAALIATANYQGAKLIIRPTI